MPRFDEGPRVPASLPHCSPSGQEPWPALPQDGGLVKSPGQEGRGRGWRGLFYSYKGQGTGSDSSLAAPGKPAPHSPTPRFAASSSCRGGRGEGTPRLHSVLGGPAPPTEAGPWPGGGGALGRAETHRLRELWKFVGEKSLRSVCPPRACGEIKRGPEGWESLGLGARRSEGWGPLESHGREGAGHRRRAPGGDGATRLLGNSRARASAHLPPRPRPRRGHRRPPPGPPRRWPRPRAH